MGREGEVVTQLLPQFEKEHPGIRVQVQQIPWTAAHEKLLTAFVGDATPDIAQLGNTWIPEFVALDALEPLDAASAASKDRPAQRLLRRDLGYQRRKDTTLRHPVVRGHARALLSHRPARERRLRLDASDMGRRGDECMVSVKKRMGPRPVPAAHPDQRVAADRILGLQAGSPLLARQRIASAAFSDPQFLKAFDFYVGLFRDGLAPPLSGTEISNLYQEFERGNIAMYITGRGTSASSRTACPPAMQEHVDDRAPSRRRWPGRLARRRFESRRCSAAASTKQKRGS